MEGIKALIVLSRDLSSNLSVDENPPTEGEIRSKDEPMLVAVEMSFTPDVRRDQPVIAI